MRVAMVSDCYLPRLGGIEVEVSDLAAQLRLAGHDVTVLTATPGPPADGVRRLLPPVPLPVPVNPWAGPQLARAFAGADVVHVHLGVLAPFADLAMEHALRSGVRTVVTWHSMLGPARHLPERRIRWRRWVRAGAVPTVVSEVAGRQVQAVLGNVGRVQVLHNGIDPARWAPPPGPAPVLDGEVRLLSALRVTPRKRPVGLLRIADRIRRQLPAGLAVRLEVAGDGPVRRVLERVVAVSAMASWVRFTGRLPREELVQRYHRAHLYLAPARMESFGIAALEARTAGVPVAGLLEGGVGEFVVDGVNGLLAEDDASLADRSAALVRDPHRLAALAETNRSTVPPQAWSRVIPRTEDFYRGAAG